MTKNMTLIIMSAGESTRFRADLPKKCAVKKQWIRVNGKPLWLFVADILNARYKFAKVIITASALEVAYMKRFCDYEIVCGGNTRQKSLENALKCVDSEFVAVSDAARFGVDFEVLDRLFAVDLGAIDCVMPVLGVADTIFIAESNTDFGAESNAIFSAESLRYLNRNAVKLVQTPQISRVSVLQKALKLGDFSDESSAINALGGKIATIKGSKMLDKLTDFGDLERILGNLDSHTFGAKSGESHAQNSQNLSQNETFIGYGFDTHRFCDGDEIVLCGVKIPCEFGIEAHSDGDVALHALMDALLGAVGAGDIGEWFPPNDARFKSADSLELLGQIVDFVRGVGFEIVNVDLMILAEIPKITPHKDKMIEILSTALNLPKNRVNIKATTMEQMGFVGRKEGICAKAVASLKMANLKNDILRFCVSK
ncbi:bifunctional 2-C-methyl-D-erythritol 4-phosphate cytidylyltransferase/2-C-methyl-D-erythritol 2,4-cyclodiphosphate synthase [Helicobacter sp. 23-1044]